MKKKIAKELNEERVMVGKWLRRFRKSNKISQHMLGDMIGLHQSAVSRLESGEQSLTLEELRVLFRKMDKEIFLEFMNS